MTTPRITCPDCIYAIEERAAIHQHDGKSPKHIADALAATERCPEHRPKPKSQWAQEMLKALACAL